MKESSQSVLMKAQSLNRDATPSCINHGTYSKSHSCRAYKLVIYTVARVVHFCSKSVAEMEGSGLRGMTVNNESRLTLSKSWREETLPLTYTSPSKLFSIPIGNSSMCEAHAMVYPTITYLLHWNHIHHS